MSKIPGSAAALALALLLAACSSTPLDEAAGGAPVETRSVTPLARSATPAPGGTAAAAGTPQSQVAAVDLSRSAGAAAGGAALMALPSQRVVYFDFDSFVIRDEFKPMLDAYAKVLAANRPRKLVVEGHTDERGGSEYNLALGQKRAEAVVKSLELLGVGANQLEAVSFGKERPAAPGHDEAAWAKNRRAELKGG